MKFKSSLVEDSLQNNCPPTRGDSGGHPSPRCRGPPLHAPSLPLEQGDGNPLSCQDSDGGAPPPVSPLLPKFMCALWKVNDDGRRAANYRNYAAEARSIVPDVRSGATRARSRWGQKQLQPTVGSRCRPRSDLEPRFSVYKAGSSLAKVGSDAPVPPDMLSGPRQRAAVGLTSGGLCCGTSPP